MTMLNVVAKHGDGTRMHLMEKLLPALGASGFSLRAWLATLGDADLRQLAAVVYENTPEEDAPSYLAVERVGMVCHLLSRAAGSGSVTVPAEILEECCDVLSICAGLVLCERQGYVTIRFLPEIGPQAGEPEVAVTPAGAAVAADLGVLLRTVVVLH